MNAREKFEKIIIEVELLISEDYYGKARDIAEKVAHKMLMGYRQIMDIFQFLCHTSFVDYIKDRKMMKAYEMLINSDKCDISNAIEISGLENHSSFATKFKTIFGMTPTEAFNKKDETKIERPLSWSDISFCDYDHPTVNFTMEETSMIFGVKVEQYNKIVEAQEYQALYEFNSVQSEMAFKLSQKDKVSLKEAFELVDNYIEYLNFLKGENSYNDDMLGGLLTAKAKKLKYLYYNVTKSFFGADELIYEAEECGRDIYLIDIDALYVYHKEPLCDFDAFLDAFDDFIKYGGSDFEEYYYLVFIHGFSNEDAVKRVNATEDDLDRLSSVMDWIRENRDDHLERLAKEETEYSDDVDEDYDPDNPYYSDDGDEEDMF